jgi:hypothetical protein
MRKFSPVLLLLLLLMACSSKNQQRSDTDQKRIEQEHQKAMEQQKQLTSGEGKSMLRNESAPSQGTARQQKQNQKQVGSVMWFARARRTPSSTELLVLMTTNYRGQARLDRPSLLTIDDLHHRRRITLADNGMLG